MLRKTYETQQGSNIKAGEDEIDFEQILNKYQQPVNEFKKNLLNLLFEELKNKVMMWG
jgi:hypothetical protein